MGIGFREYLIVDDDSLLRLTNRSFEGMLRSPEKYRFSQFGGQRIRSASVIIELKNRKPVQVLRTTFDILTFDQHGALDYQQFVSHQAARMEDLLLDVNVEGLDTLVRRVFNGWGDVAQRTFCSGPCRRCASLSHGDGNIVAVRGMLAGEPVQRPSTRRSVYSDQFGATNG